MRTMTCWIMLFLAAVSLSAQGHFNHILERDAATLPFPSLINSAGVYSICSFDVADGILFVNGYHSPLVYSARQDGWKLESIRVTPGTRLSMSRKAAAEQSSTASVTASPEPVAAGRLSLPHESFGVWTSEKGEEVRVRVPDRNRLMASVRSNGIQRMLELPFPGNLGYAECLGGDPDGILYFLVDTYVQEVPLISARFVYAVGLGGDVRSIIHVPAGNQMTLRNEFVVDGPGVLYHLFASQDRVTLFRWEGLDETQTDTLRYPQELYGLPHRNFLLPRGDDAMQGGPDSALNANSRAYAVDLAERYIYCTYEITSANLAPMGVVAPDGRHVTTPGWLVVGVNARVPYKWGGFSSLEQFHSGIRSGLYAGDVDMATPSAYSVGVDCSGFVSRCWGLSTHYGTARIPEISTAYASWDQIMPGDAMNMAGYHVRLFIDRTPNGGFLAAESGPNGHVGYWIYPLGSLGGYVPCYVNGVLSDCAPGSPVLKSARLISDSTAMLRWSADTSHVAGYRVYASSDGVTWGLLRTEVSVTTDSVIVPVAGPTYFRVSRVLRNGNSTESARSAALGVSPGPVADRILIVDAFNDIMGSWQGPGHHFAVRYGRALQNIRQPFESVRSAEVSSGRTLLTGRPAVVWFTGGDGLYEESITSVEQAKLASYLESGGGLFINGGNIGYDLGLTGSAEDLLFYSNYLKAGHGGEAVYLNLAEGVSASMLAGQCMRFGQWFREEYPDILDPAGGSTVCLRYSSGAAAGLQYQGTFGTSSAAGRLLHIGFPAESIADDSCFNTLVGSIMNWIVPLDVFHTTAGEIPSDFMLEQNYPNPFNPSTIIRYSLPHSAKVKLAIYDLLGCEIETLVDEEQTAGWKEVRWNAGSAASGVYFYRLETERFSDVKKLLLMR